MRYKVKVYEQRTVIGPDGKRVEDTRKLQSLGCYAVSSKDIEAGSAFAAMRDMLSSYEDGTRGNSHPIFIVRAKEYK